MSDAILRIRLPLECWSLLCSTASAAQAISISKGTHPGACEHGKTPPTTTSPMRWAMSRMG